MLDMEDSIKIEVDKSSLLLANKTEKIGKTFESCDNSLVKFCLENSEN